MFGQTRLLKWSIPGLAHFFTMWGFFILATVYLEAYGVLFNPKFAIPFIGHWDALGFLQDFFALAVLLGIATFAIIRLRSEPKEYGRDSRVLRLAHRRRLADPVHDLQRHLDVRVVPRLGRGQREPAVRLGRVLLARHGTAAGAAGACTANEIIETVALLLHIGVMLVFLLIVLHSKHLHIGLAPLNVTFKRLPNALGPLLPVEYKGEPIDFEDPAEDAVLGRGKIEDFTWKGYLDFTTCTECGRCQSQCPAWNTGKPLSPKLVIMNLRDHMFAKAPYILGDKEIPDGESVGKELDRPRAVHRDQARRGARGPGVRLRAGHGLRAGAGHPPARRHRRTTRRHRPRRAVVLHHLRRVRRAVPGGHRAHRPHRRHAPLPGDDGVRVPLRARRAVQKP